MQIDSYFIIIVKLEAVYYLCYEKIKRGNRRIQ